MSNLQALAFLILLSSWDSIVSAQAVSTGNCSPAIHGSQNQITVNCGDPKQAQEIYRILKMIADSQLPLQKVAQNLDQLRAEIIKLRTQAGKAGTTAAQSGRENSQTVVGANATIQQYSTGDCSPNNVGSSNITNCEPAQRTIKDEEFFHLVALLKSIGPRRIAVRHAPGNKESQVFADQIQKAFAEAGWDINPRPKFLIFEHEAPGVFLMVEDLKAEQPVAFPVQQTLKNVGIETVGMPAPGMLGDDVFEILVGLHP